MIEHTWPLLYLIACALHGEVPDRNELQGIDVNKVCHVAIRHSLLVIACTMLEKAGLLDESSDWLMLRNRAMRKMVLLGMEYGEIEEELDKAGIWHMALKGSVLQGLYPAFGIRQMTDVDILYDKACQDKIRTIMAKRGYQIHPDTRDHHDTYLKSPAYNFEMHTALVSSYASPLWAEYYSDVKRRLIPDKGCGFRFTDEDFYIYMVLHAYKHYKGAGTGIRTLADIYVFNNKKADGLDWDYIRCELLKLGLSEFEEQARILSDVLFGEIRVLKPEDLTDAQLEMLCYCAESWTHGTVTNEVKNRINESGTQTKAGYFIRRLFPKYEWCAERYPFVKTHPLSLPFFWIWRIVRGIRYKGDKILTEAKTATELEG